MFLGELHQSPPLLSYRLTQGWRKLWGWPLSPLSGGLADLLPRPYCAAAGVTAPDSPFGRMRISKVLGASMGS